MRICLPLIALSSMLVPLSAADLKVSDLRIGVGSVPLPKKVDETYSAGGGSSRTSGGYSYDTNGSQALAFSLGYTGAKLQPHGLVYGIALQFAGGQYSPRSKSSGAPNQRALNYTQYLPVVRVGYGYAVSTTFHFEITPYFGYGLARTQWSDNGTKDASYGSMLIAGLSVTGMAKLGRGWSVGGELGGQVMKGSVSITNPATGGGSDLDLKGGGLLAQVLLGYQF